MTTAQINYLNIGLMGISLIAAFVLPFEVFLFSYAFIGPLHYLTEISWLHDRQYFMPKKRDWIPLVAISLLILLSSSFIIEPLLGRASVVGNFLSEWGGDLIFVAFGTALIFVLSKDAWLRVFGTIGILIAMLFFHSSPETPLSKRGLYTDIFIIYLPTLIHVYLFTGLFILYGALKRNSKTGYASFVFFIFCALACFMLFTDYSGVFAGSWAISSLNETSFPFLNLSFLDDFMGVKAEAVKEPVLNNLIEVSKAGVSSFNFFKDGRNILVARFIAFAYTYHYLNWFSKTKIIRWHEVPKARFAVVIVLWLASIGLYLYNYKVGFQWLFLLSFAHVLLEFPLNHQSFIGIGREIGKRFGPSKNSP